MCGHTRRHLGVLGRELVCSSTNGWSMWPGRPARPPSVCFAFSCSCAILQNPTSGTRRRELSGVLGRAPRPAGPTVPGDRLVELTDSSRLWTSRRYYDGATQQPWLYTLLLRIKSALTNLNKLQSYPGRLYCCRRNGPFPAPRERHLAPEIQVEITTTAMVCGALPSRMWASSRLETRGPYSQALFVYYHCR